MTYILDTCIISKLRKLKYQPNASLQHWFLSHPEKSYFISVLTIGEIQYGISKLKTDEQKKMILEEWLFADLIPRFEGRILPIEIHTVSIWGTMRGKLQAKKGFILPVIDSLIAATALQHNFILVTDNVKDFKETGVSLINP